VRRFGVSIGVCAAAALAAAAYACASSVFVVDGRGWGHGIGMSQWGAYGYARHGWSYPRILRHYYPGTRLSHAPATTVRVLLVRDRPRLRVGCAGPIHVTDGRGRGHRLPAGEYGLGPRLRLPVGHRRVRVRGHARRHVLHRHHPRHRRAVRVVTVQRALRPPLVLDCPSAPVTVGGRAYHGLVVVHRWGGRLAAVNVVSLESYVRGVVGGEMPSRWNLAALEAQAVAARSYALATAKPHGAYDLFADTRSQVYGGLAYETPRTGVAVARTTGRILTWGGRPAVAFFFSTSGGRTAAIRDVWPAAQPLPYLRSVADPYDRRSPHHRWGPVVVTPAQIAARLHLGRVVSIRVLRNGSGRAAALSVAGRRLPAWRVEACLGLASTWFRVGELTLSAGDGRVVFGNEVVLRGRAIGLGRSELQARSPAGRWHRLRSLRPGPFSVRVRPGATTLYRVASRGAAVAPVVVRVAPRLRVEADGRRLVGLVRPHVAAGVAVARRTPRGWRVVAHPLLDRRGRFSLPLRPGGYRITVATNSRFASATTHAMLGPRLIAFVRP